MRPVWFVLFTLALLWGGANAEASSYWCEPPHADYPSARACPSPQQTADAQPLTTPPARNTLAQDAVAGNAEQPQETGSTQNHQPTFPGRSSFVRGDALDEWCKGSTTALLTAICGDDQLRALALERLHAFDDAKSRLTPDQQKTLIDDQNEWALSYPTACGLNADVQPSLPLDPSLRDCLAKAGQARLQYLKDYGQAKPQTAATPATTSPTTSPAPTNPTPTSPASATPSPTGTNGPAGTPSPAAAAPPPKAPATPAAATAAPIAPQNNETHQSATATIPPATTPAKPTPSNTGPADASLRDRSLSRIGDYTRTGAMLIAILVVVIWAITVWLQGRSRRAGKTAETRR